MQRNRRPVDMANRLRMKRTQMSSSFLVVEGDDDRSFFFRHAQAGKCEVVSACGRPFVIATILELDRTGFCGAVGVVDADFSKLRGEVPASRNLFFTDLHDIECMSIASPALESVLAELADREKVIEFATPIRDRLLTIGSFIGSLRLASARESWSIRFDGLNFEAFIRESALMFEETELINEVRGHFGGGGLSPPSASALDVAMKRVLSEDHDLWHLCCGHDLVKILSIGLRRIWGSRTSSEVKPDRLEMMLRLAYERSYLIATQLYRDLRAWEVANVPFVVLA